MYMSYKIYIPTESAVQGMILAENMYIKGEDGARVILARSNKQLTDFLIDKFKLHGITSIPIFSDEPPKTSGSAVVIKKKRPFEESKLPTENIEPVINEKLQDEAILSIQSIFSVASGSSMTTAHEVVKGINDVVSQLVETVAQDEKGLVHISSLKSYDEYTYHHSLSVSLLSLAIGQGMNLDKASLKQLCFSALLHDIGKVLCPIDVLNKPSKLTNEEFEIMKGHAGKGAKFLSEEGIGSRSIALVVGGHHEKFNGKGYPLGLEGDSIPLFSRIIAVADVYDALTSHRPYREPMQPAEAFDIIMSDVGSAFDYRVVKAFSQTVEFYPKGTYVTLSNKRQGIVVDSSHFLRPTVKMLDSGEVLDLAALSNLHLIIEKVNNDI